MTTAEQQGTDARSSIPAELRARSNWVVWKNERRSGKWTKVPYRVDGRTRAAVDNPQTWATFEQVTAVSPAAVQGIGYVFSADDPFCGVDLDDCRTPATGEVHPAAAKIVNELDSYTEISPSGSGLHIIVRATLTGAGRRTSKTLWGGEFEVYDRGRFFTMTGNGEGELNDAGDALDALVVRLFGEASSNGAGPNGEDKARGPARSVEKLIAEFPKLGALTQPREERGEEKVCPRGWQGNRAEGSDMTQSGWDLYLAGECARGDLAMSEFASLLRRARGDDAKSRRAAYVKGTWGKAQRAAAAAEKDPAKRIGNRYNLRGDDRIVRGETLGDIASGAAKVYLHCANGRVLRFPRLGDLFEAGKHTRIASQVTRSHFGALGPKEAVDIAQAIIELCGGEDADPLGEARGWVTEFIAHIGAIVEAVTPPDWEAAVGIMREERTLVTPGRGVAARAVIIYDPAAEELWLPAEPLREHSGARRSGADFVSDMAEIGWRHEEVDVKGPGTRVERARGEVGRFHRHFYVGKD